ncbi:MAG: two-component system, NtrC family, response regulator AtoC [Candidatus Binatota bacterium]|jgi:DNA-binding NtrC family response regulator|nr:two-component system, NtrC family, response regulator AtoC [Candidatus Binatota bacterium]
MRRILIVDDERNVHYSFRRALAGEYEVESANDGEEALARLATAAPDVVLLDVKLPRIDGLEILRRIRDLHPELPVVVMTAFGTTETAIRATALAARDYLLKPVDVPALRKLLVELLPESEPPPLPTRAVDEVELVGESAALRDLCKWIGRAAAADTTVMITGESGTGKELVARAIHHHGTRRAGPLVAINCAAIPDNLLESELFGHERGAFTGAESARPGRFEQADGGSILLDEIGEMPPPLQAKLLRVLQSREVTRLGASQARSFDARLIASTNVDLEARVASGAFRSDLYYRLNVFRIHVPPLRERREDVLPLAACFLERERRRLGRSWPGFTAESERRLLQHSWPGNVRELENVVVQACLRTRGDRVTIDDLMLAPAAAGSGAETPSIASESDGEGSLGRLLDGFLAVHSGDAFERLERLIVARALEATGANQVRAARLLGISRNVLRHRMAKYTL